MLEQKKHNKQQAQGTYLPTDIPVTNAVPLPTQAYKAGRQYAQHTMPYTKAKQRRRHHDVTNQSMVLAMASCVLLATLSIACSYQNQMSDVHGDVMSDEHQRVLKYADYSCEDIWDMTTAPEDGELRSESERCMFAQECNNMEGLYMPGLFCSDKWSYSQFLWLVCTPLILFLVTLFRVLGSTAEDFFSPSLEMFAMKLGLPPRFAGVTLLALGNGAADVSATISAITVDPTNGYKMSLGALTGAGMFITTVVSAVVIYAAEGIKCRGALIRDTSMYIISVIIVFNVFQGGKIDAYSIIFFISLYAAFVVVVLIADVYHRTVTLPRARARAERAPRNGAVTQSDLSDLNTENQHDERINMQPAVEVTQVPIGTSDESGTRNVANWTHLSSPSMDEWHRPMINQEIHSNSDHATVKDIDSNDDTGIMDKIMLALSNYDDQQDQSTVDEEIIQLHGKHGIISDKHRYHESSKSKSSVMSPYMAMLELDSSDPCAGSMNAIFSYNWKSAFVEAKDDLLEHIEECRLDLFENEENNTLDKFLLSLELPFIILRKLTVSVPSEGFYCRPIVALSLFFSPLWIAVYLQMGHDINLFWSNGFSLLACMMISLTTGCLVIRYGPAGEGPMSLGVATPIALWGFIIAATWIDAIADQLVAVLGFFGVILRIPGSILGMTILAWGNSMSDLAANATMARKGLANMAITACYAGPIFNMLIGLGLGFSALATLTGEDEKEVELTKSIDAGFLFLVINCTTVIITGTLITKYRIPATFGYVTVTLYAVYLVTSLVLHFYDSDDN